jgi:hypothetical protein
MTKHHGTKKKVRERMARTGESYTTARLEMLAQKLTPTVDPFGRPHFPPRRVDLISDYELDHAWTIVREPTAAALFSHRHPGHEPLPTDDAAMVNRLGNDDGFCRSIEMDWAEHMASVMDCTEAPTATERARAEKYRERLKEEVAAEIETEASGAK